MLNTCGFSLSMGEGGIGTDLLCWSVPLPGANFDHGLVTLVVGGG